MLLPLPPARKRGPQVSHQVGADDEGVDGGRPALATSITELARGAAVSHPLRPAGGWGLPQRDIDGHGAIAQQVAQKGVDGGLLHERGVHAAIRERGRAAAIVRVRPSPVGFKVGRGAALQ